MQEQKYSELEDRSSMNLAQAERMDIVKKLEARAIIHQEIEAMRSEGKALTLSDEELNLLESFRRFKIRMRKNGEVFTWQTYMPAGVQLAEDTAEIVMPREAR